MYCSGTAQRCARLTFSGLFGYIGVGSRFFEPQKKYVLAPMVILGKDRYYRHGTKSFLARPLVKVEIIRLKVKIYTNPRRNKINIEEMNDTSSFRLPR